MAYAPENINSLGQRNILGVWFFSGNFVGLQLKACFPNACIAADVIDSQLVLALVLARMNSSNI